LSGVKLLRYVFDVADLLKAVHVPHFYGIAYYNYYPNTRWLPGWCRIHTCLRCFEGYWGDGIYDDVM